MMYQCGRCGGSRASSQEYGQPPQTCTCPWEFTPPQTPPKREWVGLTPTDMEELSSTWWKPNEDEMALIDWVEAKLKEKNA